MASNLFDEFSPISEKQWKQKVQFDLKGKEFNQTLLTKTNEGIHIKPFYHKDSFEYLIAKKEQQNFKICQTVFVDKEEVANSIALHAINSGVESLLFKANSTFDIAVLLKNISTQIELQFDLNFISESFFKDLINSTKDYTTFLNNDIIGHLTTDGNWFNSIQKDFEFFNTICNSNSENTSTFCVNTSTYQNAGATNVQQVAYGLSHAFEYLNHYLNAFGNPTDKTININIQIAIGSNYFFEIAKLKSIRHLWDVITSELGIKSQLHITATPSRRNKTLYDYNTNMLRTTSEYMSAILGGANTVCSLAYDAIYHKSNEFGERIARNQLLVLKSESYFDSVSNYSDGSYYIENLVKEISEKSLTVFKEIESKGGFLKQLKLGNIQQAISNAATKEQEQFNSEEIVLVGTNKYPNEKDQMKAELELFPFVKTNPRKTLIHPIIAKRLSETLEQDRLHHEA